MDKKKVCIIAAVLVCVALAFAMTGCSNDEDMYVDEADITVDYLCGDYADQLMADGADTTLGTVAVSEEDGDNVITVTEKEVVHNSDYENGYYIAETNAVYTFGVGGFAKFVYTDKSGELVFGNIEAFKKHNSKNADQLYTVYYMNDTVELMLPVDPAAVDATR